MRRPVPEDERRVEITEILNRASQTDPPQPRRGLPVEDLISPWWVVNRSRVF